MKNENIYLGPYYVCLIDGKVVRHKIKPLNTRDEAVKEAKKLAESNQMPTFIEAVGMPAHVSRQFTSGWKTDYDWKGKWESYNKTQKKK